MSWRPCASKGLSLAGSNPAILFSVNTAQPATVALPLSDTCGSCASGGRPLSELAGLLVPYPQELRNVRVEHKIPFEENAEIADAVARIEEGLDGRGRVLLRYSGTEPLCRVMVEGQDADKVRVYANELAGIVEKALG